jgi:endonuclease/exonuclease/phosphatase family metal-dependent hydrolase
MPSVLTLNLRFGLAADGPNGWRHRKDCFPSFFEKYRKDFIGLQEANDFQTDFIDNILTDYNFIGKRSPAPSFWQNNIIFYKKTWECIYYEHFFLSPTPMIPSRSRNSRWPRQCTVGMFKNNGHKLICVNTHFDFDASVQLESAKIILRRLAQFPSELPAIIVGDFNSTPSSPSHMLFTGKDVQLKGEDIKGPFFKNTFSKPFPCTHHGFTGDINGDHIDWILYRGEIVPENCKVIHDTFDGVYISDHFPLCASFKWKERAL